MVIYRNKQEHTGTDGTRYVTDDISYLISKNPEAKEYIYNREKEMGRGKKVSKTPQNHGHKNNQLTLQAFCS